MEANRENMLEAPRSYGDQLKHLSSKAGDMMEVKVNLSSRVC